MSDEAGVLKWIQARIPIEYLLLAALLICLSLESLAEQAPQSGGGTAHTGARAALLQCDARARPVLTWAPALCPAAAAVTTSRKLAQPGPELPAWNEACELLLYLPFVLFRFPQHKGAGLLAILASHITNGPKAPTPKDSLAIPNNNSHTDTDNNPPTTDNNPSTTSATAPTHLAVKNRFARSFSQLVASQLVPGDLITMAKSQGILTNMGVDYVVVFRFAKTGSHTS